MKARRKLGATLRSLLKVIFNPKFLPERLQIFRRRLQSGSRLDSRDVPIVSVSAVSAFFGGMCIGKSEAFFADTTDTCSDENYYIFLSI